VHKFKYNKKLYLKNTFIGLLHTFYIDYIQYKEIDIVTAVPMHISDKRKRGFNQSDILAKGLSLRLNIKYTKRSILKLRRTRKQINLKKAERLKNIENTFAPGDTTPFKGRNVLLVDDVFTTGATVNECSRILTKYGANSVYVLTLTKGV
jgi:ComF family protein